VIKSLKIMQDSIKDFGLEDLQSLMESFGEPKYRAEQIFRELYDNRKSSFNDFTTLPLNLRDKLSKNYVINTALDSKSQLSIDGTIKYLFKLVNGDSIESVLIPSYDSNDDDLRRLTLCVSSQVGCALNCAFCATGKLKLTRNLTPGEIVDQVLNVETMSGERITNIVFMGMGEPLHNLNNVIKAIEILTNPMATVINRKRITVSTSGLVSKIDELAKIEKPVKLAVSLHSTTNGLRDKLMPINKKWPIESLRNALENYYRRTRLPITFEYILFEGLNDSNDDVKRLARFVRSIPSKVNIIPFHDISFIPSEGISQELKPASMEKIDSFVDNLKKNKVNAFVRTSSGFDIDAACGQLAFSERNIK